MEIKKTFADAKIREFSSEVAALKERLPDNYAPAKGIDGGKGRVMPVEHRLAIAKSRKADWDRKKKSLKDSSMGGTVERVALIDRVGRG